MNLMLQTSRGMLLAGLAAAGCLFAGCNAAAEQEAFRKVRDAGGRISFEGEGPEVEFSNVELTDEDLASLKALPFVRGLRIINVPLTDSAVDVLLSVDRIDHLVVVNTKISPQGIKRLKDKYPSMERQLR